MNEKPFDLTAVDVFESDTPYEALAELQETTRIYWNPMPTAANPRDGFWLVTKHEDVLQVEKNTLVFSSHEGLTLANAPPAGCRAAFMMVRDGLTHLDPPEHSFHRHMVSAPFTPRSVAAMEPRLREIAARVIDRAIALGSCDFATDVAMRFPSAVVLGELFGLPEDDCARAVQWSDVIAAPTDPSVPFGRGITVIQEIYDYALSVFSARRDRPGSDVLSMLVHTKMSNGLSMSAETFVRYFWSLLTAAVDTTASAIAGGMLAFIRFEKEYGRLLADPSLVPTAVEEILRWETPTIYFRRTATVDTELAGQAIKRGQRVVMCYAAANRDSDVFANPHVFDVGRRPNDHLSFGHGPHVCLGANLARAELRILLEEMIRRRVIVALNGDTRRARSNFQNRIRRMPVTFSRQRPLS